MKPASAARGAATRRRIIEQAAPLFNRHGFDGTSMSELMAATGLQKGGLYRHFESKQSLAAAAFDFAWAQAFARRTRNLESLGSPRERLRQLIRNFIAEAPQTLPGGCPLLNTAIDSDDGDPVLRARARGALAQWRNAIAELVLKAQTHGELNPDVKPVAVADLMVASLEGAVMMGRLEGSREPMQSVCKHLEHYLATLEFKASESIRR